jgi:hypothetical protein
MHNSPLEWSMKLLLFLAVRLITEGRSLGVGMDCNSSSGAVAEDGELGTRIVDKIIGQIKKLKNSPLDW